MKYTYVAGPYTKGDVAMNVREAIFCGDVIRAAGDVPFIPHLTHFWHLISPHPYEFWTDYDNLWIEKCDALVCIAGESSGADAEVELAISLSIPVLLVKDSNQLAFCYGSFSKQLV